MDNLQQEVKIVKKYVAINGNEFATSQEAKRENCRIGNRKVIAELFSGLTEGDEIQIAGIIVSNADLIFSAIKPFLSPKEKKEGGAKNVPVL